MTDFLDGELVLPDAGPRDVAATAGTAHAVARTEDTVPRYRQIRNAWLLSHTSENTRAAYLRDSEAFFAWCEEWGFPPLALTRIHADAYREALGQQLAESTRARKLAAVSSFYRYAIQTAGSGVESNPMEAVKRPQVDSESQTVGYSLEQAQRLFEVAEEAGTWENLAVRVLLHTGMRVSALCNATTADLRREGEYTTIRIKKKGGAHTRIPLPAEAVEAIRAHLGGRTGPLLQSRRGGPITRQEVARVLDRLARRAGLTPKLTPHILRHTAATLAVLHGGEDGKGAPVHEVQQMLAHSSITTTMRYVHAAGKVERSAVHGLAAALRRKADDQ